MSNLLVIGQAPSCRTIHDDAKGAFTGTSGRRLAELAGVTHEQFLAAAQRINLSDVFPGQRQNGKGDRFSLPAARIAAEAIARQHPSRPLLIVGRTTARAFGLDNDVPNCAWAYRILINRYVRYCAVIPHPSGLNHWYNDTEHTELAAQFLREVFRGEP